MQMFNEVFALSSVNSHSSAPSEHQVKDISDFGLLRKLSPMEQPSEFLFARLSAGDTSNKGK